MNGLWQIKNHLDDSFILSFEAFNFAGGQYKKIFGRSVGPFCELLYEQHVEKEVRRWFAHTNISVPYGTCPLPPQFIYTNDWSPKDAGDYIPPYVPGNERWKVTLWLSKNEETISGFTIYGILRDNQKLIESTFG